MLTSLEGEFTQGAGLIARTCRVCHQQFTINHDKACRYHPESFSGETAQRWLPPGENEGGAVVHNFYSCCGNPDFNSPGCCASRHLTYEEPERLEQRRPGMGL
jgi:hypothetical protein